jgi:hypothetical protein
MVTNVITVMAMTSRTFLLFSFSYQSDYFFLSLTHWGRNLLLDQDRLLDDKALAIYSCHGRKFLNLFLIFFSSSSIALTTHLGRLSFIYDRTSLSKGSLAAFLPQHQQG